MSAHYTAIVSMRGMAVPGEKKHLWLENSRFVRISSLMPLNFFSRSPRKSSIASASFVAASLGPARSVEVEVEVVAFAVAVALPLVWERGGLVGGGVGADWKYVPLGIFLHAGTATRRGEGEDSRLDMCLPVHR